jgi:hypothetical protein
MKAMSKLLLLATMTAMTACYELAQDEKITTPVAQQERILQYDYASEEEKTLQQAENMSSMLNGPISNGLEEEVRKSLQILLSNLCGQDDLVVIAKVREFIDELIMKLVAINDPALTADHIARLEELAARIDNGDQDIIEKILAYRDHFCSNGSVGGPSLGPGSGLNPGNGGGGIGSGGPIGSPGSGAGSGNGNGLVGSQQMCAMLANIIAELENLPNLSPGQLEELEGAKLRYEEYCL